jgi:hypothetical protein
MRVVGFEPPPAASGTVTFTNDAGEPIDVNEPVDPEDPDYSALISYGTFIFQAAANVWGQTLFRYKIAADVVIAGVVHHDVVSAWATVLVVVAAPPQEKLYAIDGTSADKAKGNGSNVDRICGLVAEPSQYFAGPKNVLSGSDSPPIVAKVEEAIKKDMAAAAAKGTTLTIDLTGWSRGAVIAATIARDLDDPGLIVAGKKEQHISVRFVGLFDAVNQMGKKVTTPGGWATAYSPNVAASFHLIHTYHGLCADVGYRRSEDKVYPTEKGFALPTDYYRDANQQQTSTHAQVGRDDRSLSLMAAAAGKAGVPLKPQNNP